MKTYQVVVHSLGIATVRAESKAAAKRRAREADYDSYELRHPQPAITSLAEGEPVGYMLPPVGLERPVVFKTGEGS